MKVAILDFDGTLFESAGYWEDVIHDFLAERGMVPPPDILSVVKPLGVTGGAIHFRETFGLPDSVEEIVHAWRSQMGRNYHDVIPLRDHAQEYIEQLRANDVRVCLATAMERDFVLPALERTGISPLFDLILTIAEVQADKLSPRIYQACAERFAASPTECTVLEDSPQAARTCIDAGFNVIGVFDGASYNEREELQSMCHRFVDSFSELLEG